MATKPRHQPLIFPRAFPNVARFRRAAAGPWAAWAAPREDHAAPEPGLWRCARQFQGRGTGWGMWLDNMLLIGF